jgi:hypothetical protein
MTNDNLCFYLQNLPLVFPATLLGWKSISQTSFGWHVKVTSVGQNVRNSNVTVIWGDGNKLGEGMG